MGKKITEGKTKSIERDGPGMVLVINKDILSKGDGKEFLTLSGKGIWATETTCNVFELLKRHNIDMAYIERVDERTFRAYEADMVKLEIVVRNIAFGSYLMRHPEVQEGTVFPEPVIEIFFKSDEDHDPFAEYDTENNNWRLYDAKKPLKDGFIRIMPAIVTAKGIVITTKIVAQIFEIARQVNSALKESWAKQNVALPDFKIEVGFIVKNGKVTLVLADVIDNDSWRIWPLGDKYQMKDKEVFRMLKEVKPEDRNRLKENYQWVALASRKFLT